MKKIDLIKLYIHIEQAILLIPLIYILAVSGSYYQITKYNFITFTFELGIVLMHRIVLFFVSFLYHLSRSEIVLYFSLAFLSLIIGIIASRTILDKYNKKEIHYHVIICLLLSDLFLRIISLFLKRSLDYKFELFGFVFRLICLVLIIKEKRKRYPKDSI